MPEQLQQMLITIHLHTTLQQSSPQGLIRQLEVDLPPGATLSDACARLGIAVDEENMLLVVDHSNVGPDRVLIDGDDVHLIPAISGG
jgi:molybdopterin converting factor small subunit